MSSGIRQSVLALLTLVLVSSVVWLAPAQAAAPARASATTYAANAFHATNARRVDHDRARLKQATCLTRMAERWAQHMARTGKLVHQKLGPISSRCNLSWTGENIAAGYRTGRSVVNKGWMHSEGHRENILRPQFRLMGIGAARDGHGRWWVSQVFGRR